ncbi:clavaminate synthase family protein [Kitasatospora sp. A2-31]|uniref:clavaminate synthase family protein n=1 Tax=Kitasatospora sp. A2-31 TaxID=2916414 RepID=UPI001EEA38C9|nr:clavaminate synthase family protein [Kitasatospora sp. A2-31]MCG6498015.1 TauD/TfdA family dioxygenase [Kitasatospora sp. A2-31]
MPVSPDIEISAPDLVLTGAESAATERVAALLCGPPQALVDEPAWVAEARERWEDLPSRLRRALRAFRRDPGPGGALLVRGLPVAAPALGRTPLTGGSVQRTATVPAAVLMLAACGLGDPAAFRPEKTGALVQDVVPVPGQEEFQGNAGSVLLTFHNENAFHPHRPDFVMLLCLRADPDGLAGLRTSCVREVLPLLDERTRRDLRRPEFRTAPPPSFGATDGPAEPHPVLGGAPEDPDLRVDMAATEPLTERAAAALDELQRLFERTARTVRLEPGDLAVVDNRIAVHGRTAFSPRFDGTDRWLQRTFVLADLRRSRAHRAGDGYVLADPAVPADLAGPTA